MPTVFEVTTTDADDSSTLVEVSGEIDLATAPQLRTAIVGIDGDITVDLSRVSFLDSSGIGVLVSAYKRAGAEGHRFVIRGASGSVEQTMRITGVLDLFDSRDAP